MLRYRYTLERTRSFFFFMDIYDNHLYITTTYGIYNRRAIYIICVIVYIILLYYTLVLFTARRARLDFFMTRIITLPYDVGYFNETFHSSSNILRILYYINVRFLSCRNGDVAFETEDSFYLRRDFFWGSYIWNFFTIKILIKCRKKQKAFGHRRLCSRQKSHVFL